jgi:uncharacterized protein (DUF302 family)
MTNSGIVTLDSPFPFADTVQRLCDAFTGHGIKVFATIDQRAEAKKVGLDMPPTTLILFGNPNGGTPLMLAQPSSGLDLPLKALVTENSPGRVEVRLNDAGYIIERHVLPATLAANIAPAAKLIAATLKA